MNKEDLNYVLQEQFPLDCDCGCKETEDYDEYYEEFGRCEYKVKCSNCEKYLGSFIYGHWEY